MSVVVEIVQGVFFGCVLGFALSCTVTPTNFRFSTGTRSGSDEGHPREHPDGGRRVGGRSVKCTVYRTD